MRGGGSWVLTILKGQNKVIRERSSISRGSAVDAQHSGQAEPAAVLT